MRLVVLLYGLMFVAHLLLSAATQILTTGEDAATAERICPVTGVFFLL